MKVSSSLLRGKRVANSAARTRPSLTTSEAQIIRHRTSSSSDIRTAQIYMLAHLSIRLGPGSRLRRSSAAVILFAANQTLQPHLAAKSCADCLVRYDRCSRQRNAPMAWQRLWVTTADRETLPRHDVVSKLAICAGMPCVTHSQERSQDLNI
jgi:hypothetical protein